MTPSLLWVLEITRWYSNLSILTGYSQNFEVKGHCLSQLSLSSEHFFHYLKLDLHRSFKEAICNLKMQHKKLIELICKLVQPHLVQNWFKTNLFRLCVQLIYPRPQLRPTWVSCHVGCCFAWLFHVWTQLSLPARYHRWSSSAEPELDDERQWPLSHRL